MKITYTKIGRTVHAEGTDISYDIRLDGKTIPGLTIESRKRHIPHASRGGTWDHTTFHVMQDGNELVTKWSLKDAKEFAEEYLHRMLGGYFNI